MKKQVILIVVLLLILSCSNEPEITIQECNEDEYGNFPLKYREVDLSFLTFLVKDNIDDLFQKGKGFIAIYEGEKKYTSGYRDFDTSALMHEETCNNYIYFRPGNFDFLDEEIKVDTLLEFWQIVDPYLKKNNIIDCNLAKLYDPEKRDYEVLDSYWDTYTRTFESLPQMAAGLDLDGSKVFTFCSNELAEYLYREYFGKMPPENFLLADNAAAVVQIPISDSEIFSSCEFEVKKIEPVVGLYSIDKCHDFVETNEIVIYSDILNSKTGEDLFDDPGTLGLFYWGYYRPKMLSIKGKNPQVRIYGQEEYMLEWDYVLENRDIIPETPDFCHRIICILK